MKNKTLKWSVALILIAGMATYFLYIRPKQAAKKIEYTYTTLEQGDLISSISSTGALEAINTIQVGTQISGTISKLYADYNDQVKSGQVLAEMDVKLLNTALGNARANLSVAETRSRQASDDFHRNKTLFEKKVITEKEFKDSQYAYEQALSNKEAAQASVRSAEVNLGYAHITSPISGTVTERSVEQGQTVAASFATPTLFIIAEDLSKMQILADVDESDIGYIHDSLQVRFTVQTYPEKIFHGSVSQVRLQPIKINNVVNYKVVVNVDNENRLLLPGMTANLDFILETGKNVLLVNNSALRFKPSDLMLQQLKPALREKAKYLPDSVRSSFLASIENEQMYTQNNFRRTLPPGLNGIFYQRDNNTVDFDFIQLGIITGSESEVKSFTSGKPLLPGAKIINGIKSK